MDWLEVPGLFEIDRKNVIDVTYCSNCVELVLLSCQSELIKHIRVLINKVINICGRTRH
jgi:hypothetical protein